MVQLKEQDQLRSILKDLKQVQSNFEDKKRKREIDLDKCELESESKRKKLAKENELVCYFALYR